MLETKWRRTHCAEQLWKVTKFIFSLIITLIYGLSDEIQRFFHTLRFHALKYLTAYFNFELPRINNNQFCLFLNEKTGFLLNAHNIRYTFIIMYSELFWIGRTHENSMI
jgi:hypothetical protein